MNFKEIIESIKKDDTFKILFDLFYNNKKLENKEKEQYYIHKNDLFNTAISDTVFFDKLDIKSFNKNIEALKEWTCPYCNNKIPERKGNSFKCPFCKNKIYMKDDIFNKKGLFTEEEKEYLDELKSEIRKRKELLTLYEQAYNLVHISFKDNKKENINQIIKALDFCNLEYFEQENIRNLIECKLICGKLQEYINNVPQATNSYMQKVFLDIVKQYLSIYNSNLIEIENDYMDFVYENKELPPEAIKKCERKSIKDFYNENLYIDISLYKENLSDDKFEKLFLFNANTINKSLRFKHPITPEIALKRVLQHKIIHKGT